MIYSEKNSDTLKYNNKSLTKAKQVAKTQILPQIMDNLINQQRKITIKMISKSMILLQSPTTIRGMLLLTLIEPHKATEVAIGKMRMLVTYSNNLPLRDRTTKLARRKKLKKTVNRLKNGNNNTMTFSFKRREIKGIEELQKKEEKEFYELYFF